MAMPRQVHTEDTVAAGEAAHYLVPAARMEAIGMDQDLSITTSLQPPVMIRYCVMA